LIYWTLSGILSGTAVFYIDYYLKRPDLRAVLMPVTLIPMIISMLLVKKIVSKIGKRKTLLFGLLFTIAGYAIRLVTRDSSITAYVIANLVIGFGVGFYAVLVLPLATDTIEYGDWKYGIRTESLSISGITFTNKLGLGLAAAIIGFLLETSGYVARAQSQSETVLKTLFNVSVIIPLVSVIVAWIIMYTYKLDEEMPKIMKELALKGEQN
jgi:GPH family glycoside/pentoside/hexuronide:cation symporter